MGHDRLERERLLNASGWCTSAQATKWRSSASSSGSVFERSGGQRDPTRVRAPAGEVVLQEAYQRGTIEAVRVVLVAVMYGRQTPLPCILRA
jgi:hypothetical protein